MNIFISYSRHDRPIAEQINNALNAAGFETFLDTKNLPIGQEFNARIKMAVDAADLFLFLVSSNSVRPGSYTLTELSFAESKWQNPSGYVLPVLLEDFDPAKLPAYLRPVNALQIKGNTEAEVVGWVMERAVSGTAGAPGVLTPEDRLKRWASLAQPPLRKGPRVLRWRSCLEFTMGAIFVVGGLFGAISASNSLGTSAFDIIFIVVPLIFALAGIIFVIYSLWMGIGALWGGATPVAAIILDRDKLSDSSTLLHVQTLKGKRLKLSPVKKSAKNAYPGDLGWAYIRARMLIDFIPASHSS